jgi:uncharacterized membrane protein YedE/YeeE
MMEMLMGHSMLFNAMIGGTLIGLASACLMLFNGRIAGISGIVKGALQVEKGNFLWRATFICGMVLTGIIYQQFNPDLFLVKIDRSLWAYGIAGLLIGVGTGMASGCTSGHGVCGVGRLSNRSVAITMAFTGSGIVTVWVINTFFGGMI